MKSHVLLITYVVHLSLQLFVLKAILSHNQSHHHLPPPHRPHRHPLRHQPQHHHRHRHRPLPPLLPHPPLQHEIMALKVQAFISVLLIKRGLLKVLQLLLG